MEIKRIIDKNTKLFIRDDFVFDQDTEEAINASPVDAKYKARWNGESWEEGATQEYIDNLKSQAEPQEPPLEEKVAEHDIKIVTLEETIDVIYGG